MRMSRRLFRCSFCRPLRGKLFEGIRPSLLFVFVFSVVMLLFVDWESQLLLWLFFEVMLLLLLLLLFTDIGLATFSMLSTIKGGLLLSWDGSIVLEELLLFGEKWDWCEIVGWLPGPIDAEIGLRGGKVCIGCDKTFGTMTLDLIMKKEVCNAKNLLKFNEEHELRISKYSRKNSRILCSVQLTGWKFL